MSFRRNDFHNSRIYEPDPPMAGPGAVSSAIAWLKQQFGKLLRSGAHSSGSPLTLGRGGEGPYSLLGSDMRDPPESTAFPMADRDPGFQTRLRPARPISSGDAQQA